MVRLGNRFGVALHEGDKDDVAAEVAQRHALAQRQVLKVAAPHAAENHKAQVDAGGREPHHPQRPADGQQRNHCQLRAAGVDQQRHDQRHRHRHAALDHRHAGHQPPSAHAHAGADHVGDALAIVGIAQRGAQCCQQSSAQHAARCQLKAAQKIGGGQALAASALQHRQAQSGVIAASHGDSSIIYRQNVPAAL